MKIEGEFYVKDFFGDFENGMDTFIESIKEGNLPLSECMAAAIVTVITSNYNYDMENFMQNKNSCHRTDSCFV